MKKLSFLSILVTLVFLATATSSTINPTSNAAVEGFQAGRIIDDSVFTNATTMSASDIQAFLASKVPVCDTWGTQMYNSWQTRAQFAATIGQYPPFTCLKDYVENGLSAAQILYNTSQTYKINPQVLIVLLQKEQGLVTDSWPYVRQYRSATGYGCPDTAACSSTYYGFTNQVSWSAKMFRAIVNNSPNWYTPYLLGNNYIQYNPNSSCGGSTVYIQNRATQALYNYTPYQPNQAALNAGWGTASCGAYGNRNFYLYFTNWFGSTFAPSYSADYVSQAMFADPQLTLPLPFKVASGETAYIRLVLKNTGSTSWTKGITNLGTYDPTDRHSIFYAPTWVNYKRPATLQEASVAPGENGTFVFAIRAPAPGMYFEKVNPVQDGVVWFRNIGIAIPITITPNSFVSTPPSNKVFTDDTKITPASLSDLSPGSKKYIVTTTTNTGNTIWTKDSVYIGTSSPTNRHSFLTDSSWPRSVRTATMNEDLVYPGQTATFEYWIKASAYPGRYIEKFSLVKEGVAWIDGSETYLDIISSDSSSTSTLNSGENIATLKGLLSSDNKLKLMMQEDGNLVIYNVYGRPLWSTKTDVKQPKALPNKLVMQADGNLVIYNANNTPLWSTGTDVK